MQQSDVAIVGGGFSGVLTALSVLETPGTRPRVHLIEQADRFGVGAAFGATQPDHLLNVRAMNMSADPERPDDFMQWLGRRRWGQPEPFAFASRAEYGAYVQERLRRVAQTQAAAGRLDLVHDAVKAIRELDGGFELDLAMGRRLRADAVVLATGNAPPSRSVLPDPSFADNPRYVGDPWMRGAFDGIEPDAPVLLLGSGLTMVDVMSSLDARGHRGPVLALSRRGLRPQRHAISPPVEAAWRRAPGERLSVSLGRFRRAAAHSGDWRGLFDSLRAGTQAEWQAMSLADRQRFLRRLRPFWDIHRHRLAPVMAERLDGWLGARLRIEAGRLECLAETDEAIEAVWRPRGERTYRRQVVHYVINCTGPEGDPRESRSPLIQQLVAAGLVRADPLGLGMDTTERGQLIGSNGLPHPRLFAIGPAARGALWEVTAVPDIRGQARRLGQVLARIGAARGANTAA